MKRCIFCLGRLERELGELRARLDLSETLADALEGRILDLRSVERRVGSIVPGLRLVLAPGEEAGAVVRGVKVNAQGLKEWGDMMASTCTGRD